MWHGIIMCTQNMSRHRVLLNTDIFSYRHKDVTIALLTFLSFKASVPNPCSCHWLTAGLLQEASWQQAEANADPAQDDHAWDESTGHWVQQLGGAIRGCRTEEGRRTGGTWNSRLAFWVSTGPFVVDFCPLEHLCWFLGSVQSLGH